MPGVPATPPASTTASVTAADVGKAFWANQAAQDELRARRKLPAYSQDEMYQDRTRAQLVQLERESADLEKYAKNNGMWARVLSEKPRAPSVQPIGGRPAASATVQQVREVTYGGSRPSWSSGYVSPLASAKASEEAYTAKVSQVERTDGKHSVLKFDTELPHTRAMGNLLNDVVNLDADNFRDSHQPPGARRVVTKAGWTAFALAVEAGGMYLSRRILAGDVPFDPFPPGEVFDPFDEDDW